MGDLFIGIAIGIGLSTLVGLLRARTAEKRGAAVPEHTPAVEGPPDVAARLQAMTAELTAIGDASAHPRDVTAAPPFREAVTLLESEQVPLTVVTDYAAGASWMLSAAALAALSRRPDRQDAAAAVLRQVRYLSPWPMFYALQFFLSLEDRPPVGSVLLGAPEYWGTHPLLAGLLAEYFEARAALGDTITFGPVLTDTPTAEVDAAEALLRVIRHPHARTLTDELGSWRRQALDRTFLSTAGRFVERDGEHDLRIEHVAIRQPLATAAAFLLTAPFRSALVVGEPRVGKSTFVMLLLARALEQGWSVFEAGATGLMSGQQYFGQLEERLRRLTAELAVEKRVIWYVPDLLHLASSGTHRGQSASLLEQVLPAVVSGRVVMVSEATPTGLTTLLEHFPGLRGAFELVRLPRLSDAAADGLARELAARLQASTGITVAADVTDTVMQLARHYLGFDSMPGGALDLLKLTVHQVAARGGRHMDRDHVVATLSKVTGMPSLVLDARERMNLAEVRSFFTKRVIGQDEAVDAVLDRVAMLKAGLTDPGRPIGVFLFAGPTGTGKTELAKTLAAFLFGSAERLVRLDMSEFQSVESTRKILGDPEHRDAHALTDRVAKQPFSVVLLDEFEKAHPNVWDLFLQVFDDGRLTDASGRTVDFRHTILVLTSNLGSTIQQHAGPGFVESAAGFSANQVVRVVNQSFRPEFVNRLDAILVFRPLTRALMRGILLNELAKVLERRGLRDREWAVEWESSALDFLLEKGFSPAMGARPLKRAIDRFLLAPLAATLVEHRAPEGDQFLFVRSDGRGIQVEFVDPDEPALAPADAPAPTARRNLASMTLHAVGSAEERDALAAESEALERRLSDETWMAVERTVQADMQHPAFWSRPDRFDVLSRYALMDRVRAATETARGLQSRLARSRKPDDRYSRDLVTRLALQLLVIGRGVADVLDQAPVEMALAVQPSLDGAHDPATSDRWCAQVFEMYQRWADRRHMSWEAVPAPQGEVRLAVVSGFGAARVLQREVGLHTLEYEAGREGLARVVARVRAAATPALVPEAMPARYNALLAALDHQTSQPPVVRRYRLDGAPLIRDVAYGWRTGRPELVLGGDFDLLADGLTHAT